MIIFDAHLDLAMNAMEWNRDLRRDIETIRKRENGMTDKPDRGKATVCFPEMRRGNIGLCVATQIARYVTDSNPLPGWKSPEQAWAQTQGQLAWYRSMEEAGELFAIRTKADLEKQLLLWKGASETEGLPIGYVLSLEGADSIVTLGHLERSYKSGLRAIGPAHYGPGAYAFGTDSSGPLGPKGRALVKEIEKLGLILDTTHLSDESFWDAMDCFGGNMWASHSNCRTLVKHNRQFTDEQIKELIQRGAVIGAALDAWMLIPEWIRGKTTPESSGVKLSHVVNNIDHICQLAGNSLHSGIGSDLDGAFGTEQCPGDLNTIADLQKIGELLDQRGYSKGDIENILWKNFIEKLRQALPNG